MEHLNQNCGSSCGPTSLKMIMNKAKYREDLGIQDIFSIGEVRIGGTPWHRMSKIINSLNIKHKIMCGVRLDYFKNQPPNKIWMLGVYYGDIKHWVVLKGYERGYFIIYDPADSIKEYSYSELNSIFYPRNSLFIEFDLDDFIGKSSNYIVRDDDGDFVMDYVDKYQMRLLEDSNFIFNKVGLRMQSTNDIYQDSVNNADYIWGIFKKEDVLLDDYIFAYSDKYIILLRFL